MPSSSDWAAIRMLIVLAVISIFMGPWKWDTLLLAALLMWILTASIEAVWG